MNSYHFGHPDTLINRVQQRLHHSSQNVDDPVMPASDLPHISAVLFLLGSSGAELDGRASPNIVLNLRSALVRQAGDLCCPGGGISLPLDRLIGRLLMLPQFSLKQWPYWKWWLKHRYPAAKQMALSYATALREAVEEMRLNPFGLTYLGPLPTQRMAMFKRTIFPHVAWIRWQTHFYPNWEVARIVHIPLKELFNPTNYGRYRLQIEFQSSLQSARPQTNDYGCFIHKHGQGTDILWGATFRITMDFLRIVFGFHPPDPVNLPVINRRIDDTYLNHS